MDGAKEKKGIKKIVIDIFLGFSAELAWAIGLLLILALICVITWYMMGR